MNDLAFSPDGRYLATAGFDNTARFWDVANGQQVAQMIHPQLESINDKTHTISTRGGWVDAVSFSLDGRYVATANEAAVVIWAVPTGREVRRLEDASDVEDVAFSPDGQWIAAGGRDKMVRIWEFRTGRPNQQMSLAEEINAVAFSPDGKFLAAAGSGRTARVWELSTGREIQRLTTGGKANSVAFSPDGQYIATASSDRTARVWRWKPEDLVSQADSLLTRNLTRDEWKTYLGREPYRKTCPNLP